MTKKIKQVCYAAIAFGMLMAPITLGLTLIFPVGIGLLFLRKCSKSTMSIKMMKLFKKMDPEFNRESPFSDASYPPASYEVLKPYL